MQHYWTNSQIFLQVNSCKLHLTTIKSVVPERAQGMVSHDKEDQAMWLIAYSLQCLLHCLSCLPFYSLTLKILYKKQTWMLPKQWIILTLVSLTHLHCTLSHSPTNHPRGFILYIHEWLWYVHNLMDCLHSLFHYYFAFVENRLHACSQRRFAHTPPMLSFESTDRLAHNLVPLAGGAQSGLAAVSYAGQEARDKSKRPTHSAEASYYRNVSNLSKPAGKYGNIT